MNTTALARRVKQLAGAYRDLDLAITEVAASPGGMVRAVSNLPGADAQSIALDTFARALDAARLDARHHYLGGMGQLYITRR